MAAGLKPAEEFRFFDVERAESGSARLWVRDRCESRDRRRCESLDRSVAAGVSSAESFSVGALRGESIGVDGKPVGFDDAAFLREFGIKPNRPIRQPAINSEREHTPIVPECKHAAIKSERELTPVVGR
jgi:hypothetical protein